MWSQRIMPCEIRFIGSIVPSQAKETLLISWQEILDGLSRQGWVWRSRKWDITWVLKYFSFSSRKSNFLVGDLWCWLGGADRTSQFLWEGQLLHGHQRSVMATSPCWGEGRVLLCPGLLSEKVKFSLAAGKAASFTSFTRAAGRKTQGCFCITNNQHSARVLGGQGCWWCPRFGHCSEVLAFSGLHRDWDLSRAVGRWDLLMSIFVMR